MADRIRAREFLLILPSITALETIFASYFPPALYLDLFVVFALYTGWYSTPARGALAGCAFGLVQDVISGLFWGLNGLSKTFLGFAGAHLSRWVTFENLLARSLLISTLSLLDSFILYTMLLLLDQPLREAFWVDTMVKALVTGVVGGLIFHIYDRIKFPRKDFRRLEV